MPIGKNAIKRVSGSASQAATIEEAPKAEVVAPVEEAPVIIEKAEPKKTTKKAAPKKSMEVEPEFSPVKTAEKVTKKCKKAPKNEGISHFYLGDELPYYLL